MQFQINSLKILSCRKSCILKIKVMKETVVVVSEDSKAFKILKEIVKKKNESMSVLVKKKLPDSNSAFTIQAHSE